MVLIYCLKDLRSKIDDAQVFLVAFICDKSKLERFGSEGSRILEWTNQLLLAIELGGEPGTGRHVGALDITEVSDLGMPISHCHQELIMRVCIRNRELPSLKVHATPVGDVFNLQIRNDCDAFIKTKEVDTISGVIDWNHCAIFTPLVKDLVQKSLTKQEPIMRKEFQSIRPAVQITELHPTSSRTSWVAAALLAMEDKCLRLMLQHGV